MGTGDGHDRLDPHAFIWPAIDRDDYGVGGRNSGFCVFSGRADSNSRIHSLRADLYILLRHLQPVTQQVAMAAKRAILRSLDQNLVNCAIDHPYHVSCE
jgi:hypothetical protein